MPHFQNHRDPCANYPGRLRTPRNRCANAAVLIEAKNNLLICAGSSRGLMRMMWSIFCILGAARAMRNPPRLCPTSMTFSKRRAAAAISFTIASTDETSSRREPWPGRVSATDSIWCLRHHSCWGAHISPAVPNPWMKMIVGVIIDFAGFKFVYFTATTNDASIRRPFQKAVGESLSGGAIWDAVRCQGGHMYPPQCESKIASHGSRVPASVWYRIFLHGVRDGEYLAVRTAIVYQTCSGYWRAHFDMPE